MSALPIYGEHKKLGRKEKTRAGKGKGNIEGRTRGLVGRTGTEWIGPLNIESPSIRRQRPRGPFYARGVRRGGIHQGRKKNLFRKATAIGRR